MNTLFVSMIVTDARCDAGVDIDGYQEQIASTGPDSDARILATEQMTPQKPSVTKGVEQ